MGKRPVLGEIHRPLHVAKRVGPADPDRAMAEIFNRRPGQGESQQDEGSVTQQGVNGRRGWGLRLKGTPEQVVAQDVMPLSSEAHIHSGLASGALAVTRHIARSTVATQYPVLNANRTRFLGER